MAQLLEGLNYSPYVDEETEHILSNVSISTRDSSPGKRRLGRSTRQRQTKISWEDLSDDDEASMDDGNDTQEQEDSTLKNWSS